MSEKDTQLNKQDEQTAEAKTEKPRPSIYVASLSDYVNGRLHGCWIDATKSDEEIFAAIRAMLKSSPYLEAEEYAIHDYEYFEPVKLEEYSNIKNVAAVARNIAKHGVEFAHWAQDMWIDGDSEEQMEKHFLEAYRGTFESEEEYAQQYQEAVGVRVMESK